MIYLVILLSALYAQNVYGSSNSLHVDGTQNYAGHYGYGHGDSYGHLRYHGPTAIPHVLHDGHIADTHEVAAAKAAHYTAVAKAKAHSGYGHGSYGHEDNHGYGDHYGYDQGYGKHYGYDHGYGKHYGYDHGHGKHYGYDHGYGSYGHEDNHGYGDYYGYDQGYGKHYGYDHGYGHEYSGKYAGAYHSTPYHGPLARPIVLKSGYLADTHEVAAAKVAHHKAVVTAKVHSGYGSEDHYGYVGDYGYGGSYGYGHGGYGHDTYHTTPYHGPLAKPVVLKSGYLADTHEVAAAKEHHFSALHLANAHHGYEKTY